MLLVLVLANKQEICHDYLELGLKCCKTRLWIMEFVLMAVGYVSIMVTSDGGDWGHFVIN